MCRRTFKECRDDWTNLIVVYVFLKVPIKCHSDKIQWLEHQNKATTPSGVEFWKNHQTPIRLEVQRLSVAHSTSPGFANGQAVAQICEPVKFSSVSNVVKMVIFPPRISQSFSKMEATAAVDAHDPAIDGAALIPTAAGSCPNRVLKPFLGVLIELFRCFIRYCHRFDPLRLKLLDTIVDINTSHLNGLD